VGRWTTFRASGAPGSRVRSSFAFGLFSLLSNSRTTVWLLTYVQLSHPAAWSRDIPSRFARCRAGETPSRHLSGWSVRRGLANTPSHKLQHPLHKVSSKLSFQLVHDSVRETIPTCTVHGHAQVMGRKVPCRRYTSSYSRHGQAPHGPCMLE
jgi:hypothetical protein